MLRTCTMATPRTAADPRGGRTSIGHFIEEVYNTKRLHASLGNMPPGEFETTHAQVFDYRALLVQQRYGLRARPRPGEREIPDAYTGC